MEKPKPKPLPIGAVEIIAHKMGIDFDRLKIGMPDLYEGYKVELEHSDLTGGDPQKTIKIALAHLKELPDYYVRLRRVESGGKICK